MNKFVRGSAQAITATVAVAAAIALWPMSANSLHARRALALIDRAGQYADSALASAKSTAPAAATFTRTQPASAGCDACAEASAATTDLSLFGLTDLDLTDAARSPTDASFDAQADFQDVPNVALQASFEPDASAAPAAEISTAAMMSLGLAALALTARRARRAASESRRAPCPA